MIYFPFFHWYFFLYFSLIWIKVLSYLFKYSVTRSHLRSHICICLILHSEVQCEESHELHLFLIDVGLLLRIFCPLLFLSNVYLTDLYRWNTVWVLSWTSSFPYTSWLSFNNILPLTIYVECIFDRSLLIVPFKHFDFHYCSMMLL